MAGWIVRVVTVTHERNYISNPRHPNARRRTVEIRGAEPFDGACPGVDTVPLGRDHAGPCATRVRPCPTGLWRLFLAQLEYYSERWGSNPLGEGARMGQGAKVGKRGRGDQSYLFSTT